MKDEIKEYLEDILRESCEIKEFTAGKVFEQYTKDRLLKAGVERKFEIIGEALNRIKSLDDDILVRDVMAGVEDGKVVEDYPGYPKGPCVLVLQRDREGNPIYVV